MILLLVTLLLVAFGIFLVPKRLKGYIPLILSLSQLLAFVFFVEQLFWVKNNGAYDIAYQWVEFLNIYFHLHIDGLSLIFAILITGIGSLVFLYAKGYMKSYQNTDRFYFYLFTFSLAMLGLVLSGNLILTFVFWELTSVLSFLLISFFHEKEPARKAAFQSLYTTVFGGLSMLAGIILIGSVVDSYSINVWLENAEIIKSHQFYRVGLILILIGAFSKSAQFPFHFWLPGAMQAPAPVSSYLHSATMVKAGVFLIARLNPVLGGTPEWTYIIPLIGAITMLTGAYFALTQTDLKAILAYTTISALGSLVLLLGIDTKLSIKAALVFLFVHAFYKATLFMIAGSIDKHTGTRDIDKLGGLLKKMPLSFIVALLALFSMAGLPPMLGFIGKELIYEAKVQSPGIASLILIFGVTSNVFMVAASLHVAYKVFFATGSPELKLKKRPGILFLIGPLLLSVLSLALGLFPQQFGNVFIETALNEIYLGGSQVKLKIWHGFNQVFFLSAFTVFMGTMLFFLIDFRKKVLPVWRNINQKIFTIQFTDVFNNVMDGLVTVSEKNTRIIQHGYHRYYLITIFAFTTILLWVQIYFTWGWDLGDTFSIQPLYISILVLVTIGGTVLSVVSKSRLITIIAMGLVGYGLALIYLYYSAIDLAVTQILVETIIVVVFVVVLQRLPGFAKLSRTQSKIRDLIGSIVFGAAMSVLALKAMRLEFNHSISDYYLANSLPKAYGKNVVNVILVDFRALDTLGEVTVLTIAALGIFVLLTKTKKKMV